MVQKVQTILIDDIDQTPGSQTVHFALDGQHYEIDLHDHHAHELRDALGRWTHAARKVTLRGAAAPSRKGTGRRAPADRERLQAIRNWARANGYTVSDRGRIPTTIVEAFDAAH